MDQNTKLLSPGYPPKELEIFHSRAAAAVLHATMGLEALPPGALADYLTAHPRLFVGVSYLPNAITEAMIAEAKAHSGEEAVKTALAVYGVA